MISASEEVYLVERVEAGAIHISVIVLAKDEEETIAQCLSNVLRQTMFRELTIKWKILVVANGCTDATAQIAKDFLGHLYLPQNVAYRIVDLEARGKSRSWNFAVHNLLDHDEDFVFFIDSDVELRSENVFDTMMQALQSMPDKAAYVGLPVKMNERAQQRSMVNRFSSGVSRKTRSLGAINGSLYLMRADALREIWLPDETPGEDGFLNAMVETRGFTSPGAASLVAQSAEPTHFFEDVGARGFFAHERRMIVGTVINNWLCEHFWSMNLTSHVGRDIMTLNATQPDWVQNVITGKTGGRRWVVPGNVVFSRFGTIESLGWWRWAGRAPFAFAATLLSLPSIVAANSLLRRRGAARHW